MKIFDKRPLSLILCILLMSFVVFSFGDTHFRIALIAIGAVPLIIALFLKALSKSKRILLSLITLVILFSSLFSFLYFETYFKVENRFDDSCEIYGTIEKTHFDSREKSLDIKVEKINDSPFSSCKLIAYIDNNDVTNLTSGTKIRFTARLASFESNEKFDSKLYYNAKGFSAFAYEVENIEITDNGLPSLKSKIEEYRLTIVRRLILHSDKSSGGLLGALLLGEREYLDGQIELDFSRTGISHILAVSGMHLVILCNAFSRILSLLGVGKRLRKISEIVFVILYMALTGFPVSVVRAGLMVILSALLFLLAKSRDSVTNLFISVCLITIVTPYSIYDISLWLSALATLGVIISAKLFYKINLQSNIIKRLLASALCAFLSCVFATLSTLLIISISFNTLSIFSIITTPIVSPLVLVYTYAGIIFLIFSNIPLLGTFIVYFGKAITGLIGWFSSFDYALLSTDFPLVKLLILLSTVFLIFFLLLDFRKKRMAIAALTSLLICVILSSFAFTLNSSNCFTFEYNEVDECEEIFINQDENSTLITVSLTNRSTAFNNISYLKDKKIYSLDNLIIPSYAPTLLSGLEEFMKNINTENIYIKIPENQTEEYIYRDILNLSKSYRVKIKTYKIEDAVPFSDFTYYGTYADESGKCAFTILYKDEFYSYVSANMLETITLDKAFSIMLNAKTVIIGAKGATENIPEFIYKLEGKTKIYYNNNKKGLSVKILEYYQDRITVDPNGRIPLYVE